MATVPLTTAATVRGQITEALKLACVDLGLAVTVISLDADYGSYSDKTKYPLAKVWAAKSAKANTQTLGRAEMRTDDVMAVSAPWCTSGDFVAATDALVCKNTNALTEAVRSHIDPTLSAMLGDIRMVQVEVLETSLACPRAVVQWTFAITYRIS